MPVDSPASIDYTSGKSQSLARGSQKNDTDRDWKCKTVVCFYSKVCPSSRLRHPALVCRLSREVHGVVTSSLTLKIPCQMWGNSCNTCKESCKMYRDSSCDKSTVKCDLEKRSESVKCLRSLPWKDPGKMCKKPCQMWKKPCKLWEEPCKLWKEPSIMWKWTCKLWKEYCRVCKEPCKICKKHVTGL